MTDFALIDHGSLAVIRPMSENAKVWLFDFMSANPDTLTWAGGIVSEPHYVATLLNDLDCEGFTIAE